MTPTGGSHSTDPDWKGMYRAGGAAALLAGIVFRRNIAAEIGLFGGQAAPSTVEAWFALLQTKRLLGLVFLNLFDLVNYALLVVTFLALYVVLRQVSRGRALVAAVLALLGAGVYLAANTAFSMLALSEQYAATTSDVGRSSLLAAGEALLALNRFAGPAAHPGGPGWTSLLLVALGGLSFAGLMLRSDAFGKGIAILGILAGALDLAYCLAYVGLPGAGSELLAVLFIPAAGLFWMLWHILVGVRLWKLGR